MVRACLPLSIEDVLDDVLRAHEVGHYCLGALSLGGPVRAPLYPTQMRELLSMSIDRVFGVGTTSS